MGRECLQNPLQDVTTSIVDDSVKVVDPMKLILVQEFVHVIDSHDEGLDGCRGLQVHGSRKVDHEVIVVLSRGRR